MELGSSGIGNLRGRSGKGRKKRAKRKLNRVAEFRIKIDDTLFPQK